MAGSLAAAYEAYLDCLNRRAWPELGRFVAAEVRHNGRAFGIDGYRDMLEKDVRAIPDLRFRAEMVVVEPPILACRLMFDCTPVGDLFGHAVDGRPIRFAEHVFYRFEAGLILEVWSIIEEAAVGRQTT